MKVRLEIMLDEARAVLSLADQERLADLIGAYVGNHANAPELMPEELAEIRIRHHEPFDPAPEAEVEEFFARHRG